MCKEWICMMEIILFWVFITNCLIGKQVGAEEIGNGIWKVCYRDVFLGYLIKTILELNKNQPG